MALWNLGDSYSKMGPRMREKAGDAYTRIVRDYPLSALVDGAKKQLNQLEMPIPEPDQVALARMKYEQENYQKPGMMHPVWGIFTKSPDVHAAAKSGNPAMTGFRPTIPVSVPVPGTPGAAGTTDVSVSTIDGASSALDTQPDARQNQPAVRQAQDPKPEEEAQGNGNGNSKKNNQKKGKKQNR